MYMNKKYFYLQNIEQIHATVFESLLKGKTPKNL